MRADLLKMVRFLRAGLFAAIHQICAVVVLTVLAAFLISSSDPVVFSLLPWTYLIVAVGCALTVGKSTEIMADRFSHASNLVSLSSPRSVLVALVAQSVICVVALVILALRMPPDLIVHGFEFFGDALLVRIGWPATLSVGIALFGANALAAYKAIEKQK
jgi:hypothetical protein